ncbi:MAG: hypothetical protein K0Q67_605 [Cellvibrio sp.]|jgi:hypothetical protein|nr:hypothetical protein [Cellvibrio sp.]
MKKIVSALVLSLLPAFSVAHNGNDGFVTISNFQLWSNTYNAPEIRVILTGDTYYNPSNCPNTDSYMVTTAMSEKVQDRIYSALLSAVMAKKSVILRIENNGCQSGRPAIMNVIIQ